MTQRGDPCRQADFDEARRLLDASTVGYGPFMDPQDFRGICICHKSLFP
jgi:hypothetical protein